MVGLDLGWFNFWSVVYGDIWVVCIRFHKQGIFRIKVPCYHVPCTLTGFKSSPYKVKKFIPWTDWYFWLMQVFVLLNKLRKCRLSSTNSKICFYHCFFHWVIVIYIIVIHLQKFQLLLCFWISIGCLCFLLLVLHHDKSVFWC